MRFFPPARLPRSAFLLVVGILHAGGLLHAQSFAPPVLVPLRSQPVFVTQADVNGDGFPDLIYVESLPAGASVVHVLLGDGHGHFSESAALSAGTLSSVAVGDLLGTGKAALGEPYVQTLPGSPLIGDTTVEVFPGNGDGTFRNDGGTNGNFNTSLTQTGAFGYTKALRLGRQGPLGLVTEDVVNNFILTFQAGSASFPTNCGYTYNAATPLPGGAGPALAADLNGDGNPDLIVNGQSAHSAAVYLGDGDGSFRAPISYVFDHNVHSVLLADMDGDGHPDLIVEGDTGAIEIFHGNADGSFVQASEGGTAPLDASTGSGGHLIAFADLNHDGWLDLLTWTPQGISVLLGQPGLTFRLAGIYPAGSAQPTQFAVTDFNGDGYLDVALDAPRGINIFYGRASQSVPAILTTSPSTSAFEAGFTIIATLTAPAGSQVPTGDITFSIPQPGGLAPLLQTVTLVNGMATYSVPTVAPATTGTAFLPGVNTLTASYGGDGTYAEIPSFSGTHTVSLGTTQVTLTPAPPLNALLSTYSYGQPVNGYVNFFPQDPLYPVTGTWAQLSNGVPAPGCSAIPVIGNANCPYGYPQLLDTGSYDFVEVYNGDPINGPGRSADYNFTIVPDIAVSSTLNSSPNPAVVGTAVSLSATVTENYAVPTGSVSFLDGGTLIGTALLNASGTATFTTSTLSVGTHPITAVYAGNNNFGPINSGVLDQVILAVPPPVISNSFTLSVSPNPMSVPAGQSAIFQVTVSSTLGTLASPVTLSCGDPLQESQCSFTNQTTSTGGGVTTMTITTTAPHSCGNPSTTYGRQATVAGCSGSPAAAHRAGVVQALTAGGPFLAGLLFLLPSRRRRQWRALAMVAMMSSLLGLSGCGACTDLGTPLRTYHVTVTAMSGSTSVMAQGAPVTHSVAVKLTVIPQ
jgi:hypothetical protein